MVKDKILKDKQTYIQKNEEWTLIIQPSNSLFKLSLEDLWNYRDLLFLFVKRDFVSFYKQTFLGPLWFFIQPLFTTLIYVFVFGNLAGLSTDGLPQILFYMTGIIAWNYFAECLTKTSTVFKDNTNIFGKVYFPRLIMPLSIIVSNLVRFGVQLGLLFITITYFVIFKGFHLQLNIYVLLFPVMIILLALLGLGLGMIISALTTKYRDLAFLITFGVQLLMYATPVIYPLSAAPAKYKQFIALNPMAPILEGIRLGILGKGELSLSALIYTVATTFVILITGIVIFNKVEKNFIDTV